MKGSIKIGEVSKIDTEKGVFDVVLPDEDDMVIFDVNCAGEGCSMPQPKQLVVIGFPDNDSSNGILLAKPFHGLHSWRSGNNTYYQLFPGGSSIFEENGTITINAEKLILNGDLEVNGNLQVNGSLITKE